MFEWVRKMSEKPLCGYCYNECADDCCDKRRIDVLERQLEEANDELESYKCDNQVLIEIISDCLNKWNKYEAFEVLKEVNEYYKLKEKGE